MRVRQSALEFSVRGKAGTWGASVADVPGRTKRLRVRRVLAEGGDAWYGGYGRGNA